jgi:ubiquinone/menaquinone biosynthesis C-methylase UbiE
MKLKKQLILQDIQQQKWKKVSDKKQHWENVYATKNDNEVSWYEENPTISLKLIAGLGLNTATTIIDVGGGNSNLIGELQKEGFSNLSVLDISVKALKRTKAKLGEKSKNINWVVSDILKFKPTQQYEVWHDRAVFHFLTTTEDVGKYVKLVSQSIKQEGYFILATFSKTGPIKCSGLEIKQYSKEELTSLFSETFTLICSFEEVHQTPFNTTQNFIYTLFQKR